MHASKRRIVYLDKGSRTEEVYDSVADEQFGRGLLAMKVLKRHYLTKHDGILVYSGTCSDNVDDILMARDCFIEAVRLAFETLEVLQQQCLRGKINRFTVDCFIRIDLIRYMYHLAQTFHHPWPRLHSQQAACPHTAEYIYEVVAELGFKHAFREISWMYSDGCFGNSKQSKSKAAFWMRKAHSDDRHCPDKHFGECWAWQSKYDPEKRTLKQKRFSAFFGLLNILLAMFNSSS